MRKLFNGVCTALVTPFKNGRIDFAAFGNLIERQIEAGIDALCILGTTGESSTMSWEEKNAVIRFSWACVRHRVPVIYGIGGNNPVEIKRLGHAVRDLTEGLAAVMMTPPYYNKCTQDAAVLHFRDVSRAVGLPMVVYNIPGRTGMNLEPATLARIARFKNIVAIKEASGSVAQIAEVVRVCPQIAVYCGDDGLSLPCYAVGCAGIISVASNVRPTQTREIWEQRHRARAYKLFLAELPVYRALFCEVNPGPVKYALSLAKQCAAEVRAPLTTPSGANKKIIENHLDIARVR